MQDRFPYHQDEQLQQLTSAIAVCRDERCRVVQRHPFYPVPFDPPFYYGRRPCLAVVPTYLARRKVMIIGEYPNCRFATVRDSASGQLEQYVPIADINEPVEAGRYFNGYQVQEYPTGTSLYDNYLNPLGLKLRQDVWLTNVVKCFLMKDDHIETYKRLGWIGSGFPETADSHGAYFEIAAVCAGLHLAREIEICQPRLVIGLGESVYRVMHGSDDWQNPAPDVHGFDQITGVPLMAGRRSHALDTRNEVFFGLNVIHLYHPSLIARDERIRTIHLEQDVPRAKAFMRELGLKPL